MTDQAVEFIYGPNDGDQWPGEIPFPSMSVIVPSKFLTDPKSGYGLLARYVPAEDALMPGRSVLLFDGWYLQGGGDEYGPKVGGFVGR